MPTTFKISLPPRAETGVSWFVSASLAAFIAIELTRIALMLSGPVKLLAVSPVTPVTRRHHGENGSRPTNAEKADVRTIVAAHLFGTTTQDAIEAVPASNKLVLAGTIATEDPKQGVAIIDVDGPSKVYSVGGDVDGALLHAVYVDHIILDRNGRLEKLALLRPSLQRLSARSVDQTTATATLDSDTASLRHEDPAAIADVLRVGAPIENRTGKLHGFRILPGRNNVTFSSSGLRRGDLVIAVNGTSVDGMDRQRAETVFNAMMSASSATVTIERDGAISDVTIDAIQETTTTEDSAG